MTVEPKEPEDEAELQRLLAEVKDLAVRYYELTGRPLGVTSEVAEYEAAKRLGLKLAVVRTPFFDATRVSNGSLERIQIKGRAVARADPYRGRVGKIKCDGEFESVVLVLLDKATFDAFEIWEASRTAVHARLIKPGSKSRNERGSMGIAQFRSIAGARKIWPSD